MIQKNRLRGQRQKGFSLLESLISLGLFLFITTASLQFSVITRQQFDKLRKAQEEQEAVLTALAKIRLDIQEAGRGLKTPGALGLLTALETAGGRMTLLHGESGYQIPAGLTAGQTRITLSATTGLSKNRRLCVFSRNRGEIREILRIQGKDCILKNPLLHSYSAAGSDVVPLKEIVYYLDARTSVLRRKVNSAPAQPLLEDAALFIPEFDSEANLVQVRLSLLNKEEKIYEIFFYPKNTTPAWYQ